MKHSIALLLALVLLGIEASAQPNRLTHHISVYGLGGMNALYYKPTHGEHELGIGLGGGLQYSHYAEDNSGYAIGLFYSSAQSTTCYNLTETVRGLYHADNPNVTYDLTTAYNDWVERQNVAFLSIPVELLWRAPLSKTFSFDCGLGVQIDLPLQGRYSTDGGTYTTTGYFPSIGHTVSNQPQHGFGEFGAKAKADIVGLKPGLSLIGDLGMRFAVSNNLGIYVGVYASYGFTDNLKSKRGKVMMELDPTNSSQVIYHGSLATNEMKFIHLLRLCAKVGIDFGWNHTRSLRSLQRNKVVCPK